MKKYFKNMSIFENWSEFLGKDDFVYRVQIDNGLRIARVYKLDTEDEHANTFNFDGTFRLGKKHGKIQRRCTIKKFYNDYNEEKGD